MSRNLNLKVPTDWLLLSCLMATPDLMEEELDLGGQKGSTDPTHEYGLPFQQTSRLLPVAYIL